MKLKYFCILAILFIVNIKSFAQNELPNLRGIDAVNELKKQGLYDSLKDAAQNATNAAAATSTAFAEQTKILAGDGATADNFSDSVAISGNTAIVGALFADDTVFNQGAAYVFVRNGGNWVQQAKLVANDPNGADAFGYSVGISGETAVVGCEFCDADAGANDNKGAAYIFNRAGTTWTQTTKLFEPGGGANTNQFGYSVAINYDTIVVGNHYQYASPFKDTAYVFVRSNSSWTQQAALQPSDNASFDQFGKSVAIDGNTIVVGCFFCDVNTANNDNVGAAYVFKRTGTSWTQQAKLIAGDGAANDNFGVSIAVNNDTAIVGANLADNTVLIANSGAAYTYVRAGTTWTQQTKLTVTGGMANDNFGTSVDVSGETAIIGAPNAANTTAANQGKAHIYTRSTTAGTTTWTQQANFTSADGAANDKFGTSVALQNDTAVIGAPFAALTEKTNAGAGYVFNRTTGTTGATWAQTTKLTAADSAAGDNFGSSVGIDNKAIVVGSPLADVSAKTDQGAVYVFTFDNTTWTQLSKLLGNDSLANDHFGSSAAISGATVLAGADNKTINAAATQGAVYFIENYSNAVAPNECSGLTPTAAGADLSGFIRDANNRGISRVTVQLIMQTGETRTTATNFRGEFSFKNLPTNQIYFVKPIARRYNIAPAIQTLNLLGDDSGVNFIGYNR